MWNSWMRWFFAWNPTFHANRNIQQITILSEIQQKWTGPCSFPSFPSPFHSQLSPNPRCWWVSPAFSPPDRQSKRRRAPGTGRMSYVRHTGFSSGLQGVALHGNKNLTRWVDLGRFLWETTGKMGKIDAFYRFKVGFHGSGMEHQTVKMSITRWN